MSENSTESRIALFRGFVLGVLVCIGAGALYFSSLARDVASSPNDYKSASTSSAAEKNIQFVFSEIDEVTRDGNTYFLGKIRNDGASSGRGISIEVNLFLKDKFVDQYSTYMTGELGAGEERYFKVSCGCKDQTPAQHDNYKISAVGGY